MKSINFKITALFTIKTSKLNVKIHYKFSEVYHTVILLKSGYPALYQRLILHII